MAISIGTRTGILVYPCCSVDLLGRMFIHVQRCSVSCEPAISLELVLHSHGSEYHVVISLRTIPSMQSQSFVRQELVDHAVDCKNDGNTDTSSIKYEV